MKLDKTRDFWSEREQSLIGDITLTVEDHGRRRQEWTHLPHSEHCRIGRHERSLFDIREPWMPQLLVEIRLADTDGWMVIAGTGVTMNVTGPRVRASVMPGGLQFVGRGAWAITFPTLDHLCRLDVRIFSIDRNQPFETEELSRPRELGWQDLLDTYSRPKQTSADRIGMTPLTRHRLAVLFRHLLEDRPTPDNLCAAAGASLDMDEDSVRRVAYRIRDRLNAFRSNEIKTLEELGDFLVFTGQVLNPDHLDPPAEPDGE
jgi:hypothetical protein